jgi:hypothetical protein
MLMYEKIFFTYGGWARPISFSFAGSLRSDSNATMSNLAGPGRALGLMFSAAGRRLEVVVDRTAARLGFGFEGIARRLFMKLRAPHVRCGGWPDFARVPVVELAIELGSGSCAGCNQRFMIALGGMDNQEIKDLLRLVPSIEYVRHCCVATRWLTLPVEATCRKIAWWDPRY